MADLAPIKNTDKPPPEKYELPLTVAQEYGWYSKPLVYPSAHAKMVLVN